MKSIRAFFSGIIAVIILFNLCFSSFGAINQNAVISPEEKLSKSVKDFIDNEPDGTEKIPVCIWYKDIDQEIVNNAVKQTIGYTFENLNQTMTLPDCNRLEESDSLTTVDSMNIFLAQTAIKREHEKKLTDEYIMTRRAISREKYIEKASLVKTSALIQDDSIIFQSLYAPMIIAELTAEEIDNTSKSEYVESIDQYYPFEYDIEYSDYSTGGNRSYSTNSNLILNQTKLSEKLHLSGAGVKVGVCDAGYAGYHDDYNFQSINRVSITNEQISLSEHAAHVSSIIIGNTRGFSKGVTLYSTNCNFTNIEYLITLGVNIINVCLGWPIYENNYFSDYAYSSIDKWADHIVAQHSVLFVKSAGNDAEGTVSTNNPNLIRKRITSPGLAHNVITVGNFDVFDPNYPENDRLDSHSSYKNDNGTSTTHGVEKPDVIAPADDTSSAAPMITGLISLILELKPSLAAFPHVIKAIVLASCHRKVLSSTRNEPQETMEQGITECQGAGVPDGWTMAAVVSQGTYGMGRIGSDCSIKHFFAQPNYDASKVNVSMTWIRNNTADGNHGENNVSSGASTDLALKLRSDENGWIGFSNLSYSSTEMIYTNLDDRTDDNINYMIKISRSNDGENEDIKYAYAYSTDAPYITPITMEGVYFIKNSDSEKYLTYDTNQNCLATTSRSYQTKKIWILKEVGDYYQLTPTYMGTNKWITLGSLISNHIYESSMDNTSNSLLLLNGENDAAVEEGKNAFLIRALETTVSGTECIDVYMNDDNNNVNFAPCGNGCSLLPEQEWVLEKVNYRRGDSNTDGSYDTLDVLNIQNYLAHSITLDKVQFLFSDADYDGDISLLDATKIQRVLAHIDVY